MRFDFEKSLHDFNPFQEVSIRQIKKDGENVLMCQCKSRCDAPGIIRTVELKRIGTYKFEVTGWANNERSYLYAVDMLGNHLFTTYTFLPKGKKGTVSIDITPKSSQIRIGILMGADSIATPTDYFLLSEIQLICTSHKEDLGGAFSSSEIKITRTFDTVQQLETELKEPNRNNGTPMQIGEFAILNSKSSENDDLYIFKRTGLQYVCRIGDGLPTFLGDILHVQPGKIMPIYETSEQAAKDLNERGRDNFYRPTKENYVWSSSRLETNKDIFIYLDSNGFVRWIPYQKITTTTLLD